MRRRDWLAAAAGVALLNGCATGRLPALRDASHSAAPVGPVSRLFVVSFLPVYFQGPIGTPFLTGLERELGRRLQAAGVVTEQRWLDRWTITQKHPIVERSEVAANADFWTGMRTQLPVVEVLADLAPAERAFGASHRLVCSQTHSDRTEYTLTWLLQSLRSNRHLLFKTDGVLASAGDSVAHAASMAELVVQRVLRA